MNKKMRGYKVFNPDWKCYGMQYEVGRTYKHKGNLSLCESGFHFCEKLIDCFNYYQFNPNNKVAEIKAIGKIVNGDNKSVTDNISIIKEISWQNVLELVNLGKGNTGLGNPGDRNSGYWNSGNRNSGDWNSGDWNSGDRNSGNRNSGNRNSGDRNSGYWNSGDRNSGYWNSGDRNSGNRNSGYWNSGNRNSGDWNSGDWNSGYWNSGNRNSGDRNSGNRNSGYWNSGDRNSGNRNSGYWNSGNRNSGDWNSGDRNSGNRNSGDWNSCRFATGFFNSKERTISIFNKDSGLSRDEFYQKFTIPSCLYFDLTEWIDSENMTDKEKENNPKYETTEGYLKTLTYKEASVKSISKATDEEKEQIRALPNYDPDIFEEIFGIRI